MPTKLFDKVIFGPIISRRLGVSLGVNLLPVDGKLCSFDCIYCECGYNSVGSGSGLPSRELVREALECRLKGMLEQGDKLDVITFAGNGEPTLHPAFEEVIEDTIALRDQYYPMAKISVLSNSTMIAKESVFRALNRVDNNILKLDSAIPSTLSLINAPNNSQISVEELIENLKKFEGNLVVQTLFLRGVHNGKVVDNTTPVELERWYAAIQYIRPKQVMVYSLDRPTPEKELTKVSREELQSIASRVEEMGISVTVS